MWCICISGCISFVQMLWRCWDSSRTASSKCRRRVVKGKWPVQVCSPFSFILLVYLLHSVFIQIYLLQTSAFASSKCICFTQVYLLPMCIFFPSVFASLECECWLKTDDLSTGLGSPICFIQVYLLPKCISFPSASSKYICVWLLHLSVFASSKCMMLVKDRWPEQPPLFAF